MKTSLKINADTFTPYAVLIITQLVCLAAWSMPSLGQIRKGFEVHLNILSIYGAQLFLSIFLTFFISCFFYRISIPKKPTPPPIFFTKKILLETVFLYRFFLFFSAIGVGSTLIKIVSFNGYVFLLESILSGEANQLKKILYDGYSVGILSLRYLSIPCFALMILKRKLGIKQFTDIIALVFLISVVIISSRLALVFSVFLTVYLYISTKRNLLVNIPKLTLIALLGFIVLSLLNLSRNYGFYQNRGANFLNAGISEIVTYLGTPFQGALIAFKYPIPGISTLHYKHSTIEHVLNTNSSFLQLFSDHGQLGLLLIFLTIALTSSFLGLISTSQRVSMKVLSGVLLYCYAEFWRVFLFNEGIIITLIICTLLFGCLYELYKHIKLNNAKCDTS